MTTDKTACACPARDARTCKGPTRGAFRVGYPADDCVCVCHTVLSLGQLAALGIRPTLDELREAVEILKRRGVLVEVDGRIYHTANDPRRAAKEGEGA